MSFANWHSRTDEPVIHVPAIGLELTVRLPPEASSDALTIIETVNAPGFGPPLHRHRETEIFRVLEGRYLYQRGEERFIAEEGDVVTVPGGTPHAFRNITDRPARQFILIMPAFDAVGFFTGLGDIMKGGRPDRATLNAFGERWQVEFLGPPLPPP
ncbi:cupin domain-containing protein [Acuticoccus kandeliae]|uniref:cupin domain-containing protein n=1 Tax=Acuticoccus kandeliae TaxID=2073160 RepID=UPI000D3E0321|nr:cupin domain-containing protein [Acuticoccus kandeliae]